MNKKNALSSLKGLVIASQLPEKEKQELHEFLEREIENVCDMEQSDRQVVIRHRGDAWYPES